ncbi:hypothetical protein PILCRDRAFT_11841 [Piloderma croceum F 1598]|uniref:Uncharacterized protein n=1 Tax=Piloderma croceum (strain F 1598) TaxID=765440 RepID=A0A0C3FDD7_PILCF|nr:hypothetical protein PILCRDRAFT_11841 [Piloderma croceum F 1598]
MRPVDAGHPPLVKPSRTAALPVRHAVSMVEIKDEDGPGLHLIPLGDLAGPLKEAFSQEGINK